MSRTRTGAPPRTVELEMNGDTVEAKEDQTILEVAQQQGIEIPTMCWERTLTPVNACRVCVVELKGARVLAPSCARKVEDGMEIQTHSERVNHSRKMVLEFLASSVDLSVMPNVARWIEEYGADPERYGPPAPPFEAGERDRLRAGHHETPDGQPRRHRAPADEGRQRALRARLLEVHPLLQVRRGLRHRLAEHVRHRRRRARVRRPHRHRVRQPAPRLRVRLLRQLHRRLPHRRADVQERVRPPRGRPLGREQADHDDHHLHLLRRRVQPRAARAGQRDRQGHLAARPPGHARQPLHQGPLRVPVHPEPRGRGAARAPRDPRARRQARPPRRIRKDGHAAG